MNGVTNTNQIIQHFLQLGYEENMIKAVLFQTNGDFMETQKCLQNYEMRVNQQQIEIALQKSQVEEDEPLISRQRIKGLPLGLVNFGNTCYFSCLIQMLFYLPDLFSVILQYRPAKEKEQQILKHQYTFMLECQYLFSRLLLSKEKYLKPYILFEKIKQLQQKIDSNNKIFEIGGFLDLCEVFETFLTHIDYSLQYNIQVKTQNEQIFDNFTLNNLFVGKKSYKGGQFQPFFTIHVSLSDQNIYSFLINELINEEIKYSTLPNIIIFTVQRTEFSQGKQLKLETEFYFSEILYLDFLINNNNSFEIVKQFTQIDQQQKQLYCQQQEILEAFQKTINSLKLQKNRNVNLIRSLETEQIKLKKSLINCFPNNIDKINEELQKIKQENKYHLAQIAIHKGTTESGHYSLYSKNFYLQKWFYFNDRTVQLVNDFTVIQEEILKNSYICIYLNDMQMESVRQYQENISQIENSLFEFQNNSSLLNQFNKNQYFTLIPNKMREKIFQENESFYQQIKNTI